MLRNLPIKVLSVVSFLYYLHFLSIFVCVLRFIFQHLRQAAIAGRFVEFFGPGVSQLSAPDRTTIANMCPEYNATVSFFPVDQVTLKHFKKTSESSR